MEIAIGNVPADQGPRGRLPGRFGLDAASPVDRLPQGRDVGRALHRRGGPGGRRGAAASNADGEGAAVRERCGALSASTPRQVMTNAAEARGASVAAEPTARRRWHGWTASKPRSTWWSSSRTTSRGSMHRRMARQGTATMAGVGRSSRARNPAAKLVCIDIQPYGDDAGGRAASRHPERRRLLRPRLRRRGGDAVLERRPRPLGSHDRGSGTLDNGLGSASAETTGTYSRHDECRWKYRLFTSRSRVRIPSGPPLWTRSSADRAGRFIKPRRHARRLFSRLRPRSNKKGTEQRRDECLWNYIQLSGRGFESPPELPINSVAQSAEQKGSFHKLLVVTPSTKPRRMPDGTTAP